MSEKKGTPTSNRTERAGMQGAGLAGGAYGMAFIGALVYFLQQSTTFWEGVLGFVKAVAWPATLIYKLLQFLGQ